MLTKGNAGVLLLAGGPPKVPIIGNIGGHNKAVKPFAYGSLGRSALPRLIGHGFAIVAQSGAPKLSAAYLGVM